MTTPSRRDAEQRDRAPRQVAGESCLRRAGALSITSSTPRRSAALTPVAITWTMNAAAVNGAIMLKISAAR